MQPSRQRPDAGRFLLRWPSHGSASRGCFSSSGGLRKRPGWCWRRLRSRTGRHWLICRLSILLQSYVGITREDDARERREEIAGKMVILDHTLKDALTLMGSGSRRGRRLPSRLWRVVEAGFARPHLHG